MKRTLLAVTLIAGSAVPLILAATFLFGCCVLPFHHVLHRVLPLCHIATGILNSGHAESDRSPSPAAPARQRVSGLTLLTTHRVPSPVRVGIATLLRPAAASRTAFRNFIRLGALRCDQDVGLTALLNQTFRI